MEKPGTANPPARTEKTTMLDKAKAFCYVAVGIVALVYALGCAVDHRYWFAKRNPYVTSAVDVWTGRQYFSPYPRGAPLIAGGPMVHRLNPLGPRRGRRGRRCGVLCHAQARYM